MDMKNVKHSFNIMLIIVMQSNPKYEGEWDKEVQFKHTISTISRSSQRNIFHLKGNSKPMVLQQHALTNMGR